MRAFSLVFPADRYTEILESASSGRYWADSRQSCEVACHQGCRVLGGSPGIRNLLEQRRAAAQAIGALPQSPMWCRMVTKCLLSGSDCGRRTHRLIALIDTRVTVHSGHIANTFRHFGETSNAVAVVLQDGRTGAVCCSIARWREDGSAVPGLRWPSNSAATAPATRHT